MDSTEWVLSWFLTMTVRSSLQPIMAVAYVLRSFWKPIRSFSFLNSMLTTWFFYELLLSRCNLSSLTICFLFEFVIWMCLSNALLVREVILDWVGEGIRSVQSTWCLYMGLAFPWEYYSLYGTIDGSNVDSTIVEGRDQRLSHCSIPHRRIHQWVETVGLRDHDIDFFRGVHWGLEPQPERPPLLKRRGSLGRG